MLWLLLVACRPQADPGWNVAADLPAPQQECAVVAVDGLLYVIGGYDAELIMVDRVQVYDPTADAWWDAAPLPRALHHPNVAVLDGQIHVAGALEAGFLQIGDHYVYDPQTDAWTALAPLPDEVAVGAAGAAVLEGRLHLVGGLQFNRTVARHSAYDPATATWEVLPDALATRDHFAIGVAEGALIVAAGRTFGLTDFVAPTDRYAPGEGWSTGAPIPTPRGGVIVAVRPDGRLDVLGGEGRGQGSGVFGEHETYDPARDVWRSYGAMRTPRHGTAGAWIAGTLWVPGGAPIEGFGAVATNEGWTP